MIKALVKTNFYKICKINTKIWVGSYQLFKKLGMRPTRCPGFAPLSPWTKARGPQGISSRFGPRGHICDDVQNRDARSIWKWLSSGASSSRKTFFGCDPSFGVCMVPPKFYVPKILSSQNLRTTKFGWDHSSSPKSWGDASHPSPRWLRRCL